MTDQFSAIDQTRREFAESISRVIAAALIVALAYSLLVPNSATLLHLATIVPIVFCIFYRGINGRFRFYSVSAALLALAVGDMLIYGVVGIDKVAFSFLILYVVVTRGIRAALITLPLCIVSILGSAYLVINKHVTIKTDEFIVSDSWEEWAYLPVLLVMGACAIIWTYYFFMRALVSATLKKDELIANLRAEVESRAKAEKELADSQSLYQMLANNVADYVWTLDLNLNPVYNSPSVFQQRGFTVEEIMQQTQKDIISADTYDYAMSEFAKDMERLKRGEITRDESRTIEYKVRCKDGSEKWVESVMRILWEDDAPVGILGTTRDISERKKAEMDRANMEQQMLHAQKLKSLGMLAGGIAHDFNNILVSILGNVDLAREKLGADSPAAEYLDASIINAKRAGDLCQQLLAYSGRGKFLIKATNIGKLASETVELLKVSVPKTVVLSYQIDENLPLVEVDVNQWRQVIMNLVMNSSESISGDGEITIHIGSESCTTDDLQSGSNTEALADGCYVKIEIADTGCGMEPATLSTIFDPFFTTKDSGYGLGLAAVLGIVHGHNGTIKVRSVVGNGSTFTIFLPCS